MPRAGRRRSLLGMLIVDLIVAAGVAAYLTSGTHERHDPVHALQQLDAFYLDEPAPAYRELGLRRGEVALIVVCESCRPPGGLAGQIRVTDDAVIAERYALRTESGRLGPGYAVIDRRGHVRYRTFDPGLGEHRQEIEILVERAQ